jgi:hypothetical protein
LPLATADHILVNLINHVSNYVPTGHSWSNFSQLSQT